MAGMKTEELVDARIKMLERDILFKFGQLAAQIKQDFTDTRDYAIKLTERVKADEEAVKQKAAELEARLSELERKFVMVNGAAAGGNKPEN
jgi:phosphomevalonate kinase